MLTRQDTYDTQPSDCRADGSMRLAALMNCLQKSAAYHAQQLGFGYQDMLRLGGYWVLSNIRIDIDKLPARGDVLTVKTWPSGCTRLAATREFIGFDAGGGELFKATSEWLIIDQKTKRPMNLSRNDFGLPSGGPRVMMAKVSRLKPRNRYDPLERIIVSAAAIDINGHVNNTEYVRWATDAIGKSGTFDRTAARVQVTYLAEVAEGEQIELAGVQDDDSTYALIGKRPTGEAVFLMELKS